MFNSENAYNNSCSLPTAGVGLNMGIIWDSNGILSKGIHLGSCS